MVIRFTYVMRISMTHVLLFKYFLSGTFYVAANDYVYIIGKVLVGGTFVGNTKYSGKHF